ncbi:hypothetical protein CWC33_06075 [Idiomarina sp. X4]|uniref:hypothetical protein n=1 Tax=Idiomarina sp. X4 TaxID=2055892 RepID=UPI000C293BC6|nr:hypothetical protein [Idiomarina sp. X4]ATZ73289.1 hypothetical protein CWC33_06075 [Idiomarina sp. X4]
MKKLFLTLAAAGVLSACGGGGSESTPQLSVSIGSISSIDENSSESVSVSASGAQGSAEFSIDVNGPDALSIDTSGVSSNGGNVQLSLAEIFEDGDATLSVTARDSEGRVSTKTASISLVNVSGFDKIETSTTASSIAENSELEIPLSYLGSRGTVTTNVTMNSAGQNTVSHSVSTTSSGVLLTFTADEFSYNNHPVTVEVQATDSEGKSQSIAFELTTENTSGSASLQRLQSLMSSAQGVMELSEQALLVERLEELAVFFNDSYTVQSPSLLSQLSTEVSFEDARALEDWLNDSNYLVHEYNTGAAMEANFPVFFDNAIPLIENYLGSISTVLQASIEAAAPITGNIELTDVYVSESGATVSQLVGNPALGEFQEETWVFKPAFEFLEAIAFPESQTCSRNDEGEA